MVGSAFTVPLQVLGAWSKMCGVPKTCGAVATFGPRKITGLDWHSACTTRGMDTRAEPIYTYKKGEGWVINAQGPIVMRAGKCYRFEARYPKPGERYCHCNQWDIPLWNDSSPIADIEKWTIWAEKHGLDAVDFSKCEDPGELIMLDTHQYVTVIPL